MIAGVPSIGAVQPVRGATWIEAGTRETQTSLAERDERRGKWMQYLIADLKNKSPS
jgi:hypothetical protein